MVNPDSERDNRPKPSEAMIQQMKNFNKLNEMIVKYGGTEGAFKGLKVESFDSEVQRIAVSTALTKVYRLQRELIQLPKRMRDEEREWRRYLLLKGLEDDVLAIFAFLSSLLEKVSGK